MGDRIGVGVEEVGVGVRIQRRWRSRRDALVIVEEKEGISIEHGRTLNR
jgi:hypothetical protein